MVNVQRESEATSDGVARRAILKSAATVCVSGIALTGTASAGGFEKITFRAAENETLEFQLIVTGRVKTDGGIVQGVVADADVQIAGNVVQGVVSDGNSRSFELEGEISILQLGGRGTVILNGEVIRDTTGGEAGDERLPKMVIVTTEGDTFRDYIFEVTGDLEKLEPNEDSGQAVDEVSRRGDRVRVEGSVGTGDDRFAFSGRFIPIKKPPEVRFEIRDR